MQYIHGYTEIADKLSYQQTPWHISALPRRVVPKQWQRNFRCWFGIIRSQDAFPSGFSGREAASKNL
jgi:hypothetical protein